MPEATNKKAPLELDCPTCGKTIVWSNEFPERPFCSPRCKQIDFGDWANEAHAIPGQSLMEAIAEGELDPEELADELEQQGQIKH